MIPARKKIRFVRWFARQTQKRIQKMFSAVYIRGEERLRDIATESPVLVVSNHTSWWDPMFSIYLGHVRLKLDAFAMMDGKNLQRLPFLGRIGGFGFDLKDPVDCQRVLAYTTGLLDRPGRLVWIFPEGAERPRSVGLDVFRPGAAIVAKKASINTVIPVGLRYEFTHEEHPEAFISIGDPLPTEERIDSMCIAQAQAVRHELACIDAFIEGRNDTQFVLIMKQRPSYKGLVAERLLCAFTRYRG